MSESPLEKGQTFWEHFTVLRVYLVRFLAVALLLMVIAFIYKEPLFKLILAPNDANFITYRLFDKVAKLLDPSFTTIAFHVKLINIGLAGQFFAHMNAALFVGILGASPYALFLLFRFVSPALHDHERKYALYIVGGGYIMFIVGAALSYFLIFPLTFRFLGTYQVNSDIENLITLQSYIDSLLMLCLALGVVFEIPIISWLLAKIGFLSAKVMRKYRRHAIIVILLIAAIITPTTDIFTLSIVSIPMIMLYEVSIHIVSRTKR